MKTALLYNYNAGKGLPARQVVQQLCSFFDGDELLVTDEGLLFADLPVRFVKPDERDLGYYPMIRARVDALAKAGADRFISVGGDGTATYVRNAMFELGLELPILGVAAGTANVGPIVSLTLEQLTGKHISQARQVPFDGLAIYANGKFISLAFNDVIVGDTFLATVDGQGTNVSVRALLEEGKIEPKSPCKSIVTDDFCVMLNGRAVRAAGRKTQQIILSSVAHESHYGRAVYGPVGKCDWSEKKGVIALCDFIAVSYEDDGAGVDRFSTMDYLIFGPNDQVVLQGFDPEACLVCDGNPYLLPGDSFEVQFKPALVSTITL